MSVTVHHGDCLEVIRTLADESMDSCVTDPPYALVSISKRFGKTGRTESTTTKAQPFQRHARGFMGKQWDNGTVAFSAEFWAEVLRVLKPGAHLLAFGGTRTYHRLACAIEDAGFEIRDCVLWHYGSGFPKSHDVSKGIDRHNGHARPVKGTERVRDIRNGHGRSQGEGLHASERTGPVYQDRVLTSAASAAWEGWGTALKPATEIVCLARKPLIGTVAVNVLRYGTGALNIDGCRVAYASDEDAAAAAAAAEQRSCQTADRSFDGWGMRQQNLTAADYIAGSAGKGRWPANLIHDGSPEVLQAFPDSDGQGAPVTGKEPSQPGYMKGWNGGRPIAEPRGDIGSAARFFYAAKADAEDRLGSKHPTVKPVDLIAYLCRLVTPPGGTVLDPFAGSGTTGMACMREGFSAVLIEREAEYVADIRRRIEHVKGADTPLFATGAA